MNITRDFSFPQWSNGDENRSTLSSGLPDCVSRAVYIQCVHGGSVFAYSKVKCNIIRLWDVVDHNT